MVVFAVVIVVIITTIIIIICPFLEKDMMNWTSPKRWHTQTHRQTDIASHRDGTNKHRQTDIASHRWHIQTHRQTDIASHTLNWPRGRFSEQGRRK